MTSSSSLPLRVILLSLLGLGLINVKNTSAAVRNYFNVTSPKAELVQDDVFIPYQGERFSVFDWNFCKVMASKYRGNFLMSPLSLKITLVLLLEGAEDQTANEIERALHLPLSGVGLVGLFPTRNQFRKIIHSLQPSSKEYKLNLSTRIFMKTGVSTRQTYASLVETFYSTKIVATNFDDSRNTLNAINTWVSETTEGNIKNMIDDENSIKNSVMLLMNVLFFKGLWSKNHFDPKLTTIKPFHESATKVLNCEFMTTVGNFYYAESLELDAKILRIPYLGNKFSMYIILPRTLDGLDNLIRNIDPFVLTKNVWLTQSLPTEVSLPKFKFLFTSHLEPALRELGIQEIFEENASLTGIAHVKNDSPRISVSDFIQKVGIEVNEEGTVAFAATEVDIGNKVGEQEFYADHPFMFYIEDETTGTILYMGRVTNPTETTGTTDNKDIKSSPTFEAPKMPGVHSVDSSNTERSNYFNSELFQEVNDGASGNTVMSPMNIKSALTVLTEVTGGKTRQELLATLRLPLDSSQIRAASRNTLLRYQGQKSGTEINFASRLWATRNAALTPEFNNLLISNYGCDSQFIDFKETAESARMINDWVRLYTANHIPSIVEPGSLNPETQVMLTSALYFKGTWLKAFDLTATRTLRCFRGTNNDCHSVPMMENIAKYRYGSIPALDADVVELPYTDGKLSMLILLPKNEGLQSLQTLSKDLAHRSMSSILSSLEETEILLQIPKFTAEYRTDLRPALEKLGIKDLFGVDANLTGILSGVSARVGSVLHTARIEINEAGTIAAAVTGISVVPLIGSSMTTFRADRPFLFTIIDRQTESMIFAGRIDNPINSQRSRY